MDDITSIYLYPEAMKRQRDAMFEWYKTKKGAQLSDNELELACFGKLPIGHKLKGDFCVSLSLKRWPWLYVEKDGVLNFWFIRICRTLCTYRRVYLVGTASGGKTFGCAVVGMNMWGSSPWNTTFLVTSTDKESLDSKAWGTIRDLHDKDTFKIGVRVDYEDVIILDGKAKNRDLRDSIKAIPLPKGAEGEKAIGKVQGRKNQNIAWLADEFSHMDPCVQKARSNLASAPSFCFWACSNKPEEGCPAYQDACPDPEKYPLGWNTPGLSDLTSWPTKGGGITLYLDGLKSPNTLAKPGDPDPFPMLTRRDYIETIRAEETEEGYGWWKFIRAFPKTGESHDKLLDQRFLERYRATEQPIWAGPALTAVAGMDAAWTQGGDSCMADFGRVGINDEGIKILAHEPDPIKLNAKVSGKGTFEEQLSDVFIDECQKRDCHIVAIDISGSGGRMANAVRDCASKRSWKLELIAVDAAGKPDPEERYQVGSEMKEAPLIFDRRTSEIWVGYRLAIQQGVIRGLSLNSKAVRELCDRRIDSDQEKRFVIEKKKFFKERNQGRSPDSGEARVLCALAARKTGLGATIVKKREPIIISDGTPSARKSPYSYGGQKKAAYTSR